MAILFITVLIDLIGFGLVIPILPFLAPQVGASNFDIALIIAIYSVCAGLFSPFWGKLSDRIGRKPVILICLVGASLSYLFLAYATQLWMLYATRAFGGVMAGNFGVASAMIGDITAPKDRAKRMGMIGSAFGLGMVIGPFMGGVLAGDSNDFIVPCLVASAMSMLAVVAGGLFLQESLDPEKRSQHAALRAQHGNASAWRSVHRCGNSGLILQYLLHSMAIASVTYLFPLWVAAMLGWGAKEVGMVFGIQGLAMAALQGIFIGRLATRFGELNLLLFGSITMTLSFCVISQAQTDWLMVLSFFTLITGATCCTPILNSVTSKRSPPHLLGQTMGLASAMGAWGRSLSPVLAGILLLYTDYALAWLAGCIFSGLMVSWVICQMKKPVPPTDEIAPSTGH